MSLGWSPDVRWRSLAVRDALRRLGPRAGRILEIGCGDEGIRRYVRRPVVAVDIRPGSGVSARGCRKHPAGLFLLGSGCSLPFADRTFPAAVAIDVLEHVPPQSRARFTSEALRVTSSALFLMLPVGEQSLAQDRQLAGRFLRIHRRESGFLAEHLSHGLPDANDVREWISAAARASGREAEIREEPHLNLTLRGLLLRCHMGGFPGARLLYKAAVILGPWRRFLNAPPCYRRLFAVRLS